MVKSFFTGAGDSVTGVTFRTDWNDQPLREALKRLNRDGGTLTHEALKELVQEQIPKTQKWLHGMAGSLANVKVPPNTDHAFVKIAKSLTFTDKKGAGYLRIYSGPNYQEGVQGSRGGYLAQIHTWYVNPFPYSPKLPQFVRSSTRFYRKTGKTPAGSYYMTLKGIHPGFPNPNTPQVDYTMHAEKGVTDDWPNRAADKVVEYSKRAGFGAIKTVG